MTLTLNTNLLSFTELVVCIYQIFRPLAVAVSEISIVFLFPIEKPRLQNLTLR